MRSLADIAIILPGLNGYGFENLGRGWSWPEAGFRWMTGNVSTVTFPAPEVPHNVFLVIDFVPFGAQRLSVKANGAEFGNLGASTESIAGFHIPTELVAKRRKLTIEFAHPDGRNLAPDKRKLTLAIRSIALVQTLRAETPRDPRVATNLSDAELMANFESLGDNCEFGIAQLRNGANPLGLLRFAGIGTTDAIRGVTSGFTGIANDLHLELAGPDDGPKEYVVKQRTFRMVFHSMKFESDPIDNLLDEYKRKLDYLARKLVDDLQRGDKIFICKRNPALQEHEVLPLWLAVRRHGKGTLLWVVPATGEERPGSVEWIHDGLMKGYMEKFAPHEDVPDQTDGPGWLKLCRSAYLLNADPLNRPAAGLHERTERLPARPDIRDEILYN